MDIPLTYEDARAQYPELVLEIAESLIATTGSSKTRKVLPPLSELEWSIGYGARIGPGARVVREKYGTQAWADGAIRAWLGVTVHRYWHASAAFETTPVEIINHFEKTDTEWAAAQARIDAMTPEERAAKIQEALSGLRGTPGFIELQITNPKENNG